MKPGRSLLDILHSRDQEESERDEAQPVDSTASAHHLPKIPNIRPNPEQDADASRSQTSQMLTQLQLGSQPQLGLLLQLLQHEREHVHDQLLQVQEEKLAARQARQQLELVLLDLQAQQQAERARQQAHPRELEHLQQQLLSLRQECNTLKAELWQARHDISKLQGAHQHRHQHSNGLQSTPLRPATRHASTQQLPSSHRASTQLGHSAAQPSLSSPVPNHHQHHKQGSSQLQQHSKAVVFLQASGRLEEEEGADTTDRHDSSSSSVVVAGNSEALGKWRRRRGSATDL
jgi:hypothetical protein